MGDRTKIEWADATVNAVNGCSVVSPGCTNCYAMRLAGTRMRTHSTRAGLTVETKAGPVWNGQVRLHEAALLQPLRWRRPRRIFWNAHGDLFHDSVPDEWIDRVFAVCALTPQHTHQILTKRSARMRAYMSDPRVVRRVWEAACDMAVEQSLPVVLTMPGGPSGDHLPKNLPRIRINVWPLPSVWLGVSVEDQTRADERIPDLLATPAAVRFLSAEPLLGPLDLTAIGHPSRGGWLCPLTGEHQLSPAHADHRGAKIDWVIAGGESGPGARPMHPGWAKSLRDQCAAAGVAFHFKQWGAWVTEDQSPEDITLPGQSTLHWLAQGDETAVYLVGKKAAGRLLDGIEHNGMPSLRP